MNKPTASDIEVTQEDIDEARRSGLTGSEMLARAIRRQYPDARRVQIDVDTGTVTIDTGGPLVD